MSAIEIAAEQIVWWQGDGMSIKECLHALGRRYSSSRTWGHVFSALLAESRRLNPNAERGV